MKGEKRVRIAGGGGGGEGSSKQLSVRKAIDFLCRPLARSPAKEQP